MNSAITRGGLFGNAEDDCSLEQQHIGAEPHERAVAAIRRVIEEGHPLQLAYSAGKDSALCVHLTLTAARAVQREGRLCPPIVVSNIDTQVESPVVRALAETEMAKMTAYAKLHRIPLETRVGRPTLSAGFAARVIGGRALPTFPQSRSQDCSVSWKVKSGERIARQVRAMLGPESSKLVTVIGTRSSESAARGRATAGRKETAHEIWCDPLGELRLSPILDWTTDEVWEVIGEIANGFHESYTDFAAVAEFYADAGGSSCAIVAELKSTGTSKPCGARSGCWACVASGPTDKSVETMLEQNPGRYPYLVPLLKLRNFLSATAWDWSRRNYLGRTINDDGTIQVSADQYSPQMVEDLLYYTLAAQDEANSLGSPSLVRPIGVRELVAIDFYWSSRAWHPPWHALAVYFDHCNGNVKTAPAINVPARPSAVPSIGRVYVGEDWDSNESPLRPAGLRHPMWELFSESCGASLRTNAAGKVFLSLDEEPEFTVDEEGAIDFLTFFAEEKIAAYHRHDYCDWTLGALIRCVACRSDVG
ncbi:MAG: phosphoadenosine phosphosulfate reductase family protein [Pseudomonadota bacterium]